VGDVRSGLPYNIVRRVDAPVGEIRLQFTEDRGFVSRHDVGFSVVRYTLLLLGT
jgi:hypothetical protein